ncbi:MAG: transposon-transfer assisting family protein [Lachnospiraceae bacterium]|nr:transposon-transfer assisting family protein [Lachnospiraceae bacterium]
MNEFTFEEMNLMAIYNASGTREGLMEALTEMRGYLDKDETELLELTNSALDKLERMDDVEFAQLELVPEFDE